MNETSILPEKSWRLSSRFSKGRWNEMSVLIVFVLGELERICQNREFESGVAVLRRKRCSL